MFNLTQHCATPVQIEAGVVEPKPDVKERIKALLTFDGIPNAADMDVRGYELSRIVRKEGQDAALIGGAPFFMAPLERQLFGNGVQPVYAFSKRESVESTDSDGNVVKKNVFRHVGFYAAEEGF